MSDVMATPSTKAELSDAQFITMTQATEYDRTRAIRFVDTKTVKTLTALAKRGYATLVWGPVDGRPRGIQSATITGAGRKCLARETERRAAVEAYEALLASVLKPAAIVAPVVDDETPELGLVTGGAAEPVMVIASKGVAARMDPFEVIRTAQRREVEIPF